MTPDLSIIIVSWNVRSLLADVLARLPDATHPLLWETIVVDNASTDGSADMVAERFPEAILLRNETNQGFGRANNIGAKQARGHYILLLNSDTITPPNAFTELVQFMEEHPSVGVCSPRLLLVDGSPQPYAFGDDPRPAYLFKRGFNRLLRHKPLHNWATDETLDVEWVSGACMLLRREVWEQVSGFDERFFMYFEDNDLCLRIRQAGWQVVYHPSVEITHLGGQSLRQNPDARRAYQDSLRYFYRKHYGPASTVFLNLALPLYTRFSGL